MRTKNIIFFIILKALGSISYNGLALGEEGDFTHHISKYLVAPKLAQIFY